MRTRDFSAAPPLAQAAVMLTVEPGAGSRAGAGWLSEVARALSGAGAVRREWLRAGVRRAGVVAWYADASDAEAALRAVRVVVGEGECTAQIHHAHPDGYSNGVWRAEDGQMRHIERFTPVGREDQGPTVARRRRAGSGEGASPATAPAAGVALPSTHDQRVPAFRVQPVRTRADLRDFLRVPPWGTPRATHGVPLWDSTVRSWWTGRGPHRAHGAVELLLVRDPWGYVAGRTTLHTDRRMDAKLGEPTLLMGATEFAGAPALAALVEHAEATARQRGRTRLLGPVSLLPNQVGGVVTSGWEHPGFLDGPWSPSHYPRDWEALGFERIWEGATWICRDVGRLDAHDTFPGATLPEGMRLRKGDRGRLDAQLPILREMLNAAFAELGYYTPIEADELAAATEGLAHLLDEELLLWVEQDGRPLAFVLVVPDLTDFVRATGGRLGPVEMARLLLTKGRYRRDAVLIIKGTVPDARGQGLMTHLSRELLHGLQHGGYRDLRVTFIEDGNAGSQAQFEAMGGMPLHGTCFYTKAVGLPGLTGSEVTASGVADEAAGLDTPGSRSEGEASAPDTPGSRSGVESGSPAALLLARTADWGRAPSAHNTQPWDVRALDGRTLALGWHEDRALPVADPTRRDLLLSLGAVALSLQVVAADLGLRAEVAWKVDEATRQAATLRLTAQAATQEAVADADGGREPGGAKPDRVPPAARDEDTSWRVEELLRRATVRAPFPEHPDAAQVAALAEVAGLPSGVDLVPLPDDLVDELLPKATAHALSGEVGAELAGWLRLRRSHPRHDLDGLSADALGLSTLEARGLGLLTGTRLGQAALGRTGLDRLLARLSQTSPRGTVVALAAPPRLSPDQLGDLGGHLLAAWLAGERRRWSAHPLSELVDEPGAAGALRTHVTDRLGRPSQAYAVWRWGRPAPGSSAEYPRSPRVTD